MASAICIFFIDLISFLYFVMQSEVVSKITNWVEESKVPTSVMTYRTDSSNNVTASRPVYPYPAVAKYTGSGDWHDGANYTQGAPLYTAASRTWAGSSFYATPDTPATRGVAAP